MSRACILFFPIMVLGAGSAFGDKVYLKDGRKLSGTAKRHRDGVDLTTDDGKKLSFARDDVKRVVFESAATPKEVLEMLDEFEDLIAPAFGLGQPEQREFGKITSKRRSVVPFGERPGWHSDRDYTTEEGRAREVVDSDKFVDDWVRFAAHFEAIAKTRTYKQQTRAKRRKKSLAEYARYPPEELKELGDVLGDAIEAVKETFELAERANSALTAVRSEGVRRDRQLARARDHSRRTDARRDATKEDEAMARARVSKLRDDKAVRLKEMQLGADNVVNRVAAARIIAIQQLIEFRRMLEGVIDAGPTTPSTAP